MSEWALTCISIKGYSYLEKSQVKISFDDPGLKLDITE
jgi:hypothetical protein